MLNLRFDIDTKRGLVHGVPPLLDLLDDHGLKASFYCVMGPEANLIEIIRLRLMADRSSKSPLNTSARGGPFAVLGTALMPGVVGSAHPDLLVQIVDRGHELQPHGWSHIQWQRNIEHIDVDEHLQKSLNSLGEIIGHRPVGFAAPGRTWNAESLSAFDDAGLAYSCDMGGTQPFRPEGYRHLQMPITRFETIAQMRTRGLSDQDVVDAYISDIASNPAYCCIFEHPDDLTSRELTIFERLFGHVRHEQIETATLGEIAAGI